MGSPEFGKNPISIEEAFAILRNRQLTATKGHARVHQEAMEDNTERIRALEKLCGDCSNLSIKKFIQDGKKCVGLHCKTKRSPLDLIRRTELGEKPNCPNFLQN